MKILEYFHPLKKLAKKRQHFLQLFQQPALSQSGTSQSGTSQLTMPQSAMPHLAQHQAAIQKILQVPLPVINADVGEQHYIVVDFETTGLDPIQDNILSIGWVEMKGKYIELDSATEVFIKDVQHVKKETAVINHIVPEMLQDGITLNEAILRFLTCAKGKIIIAHGCIVEQRFLDHYAQAQLGLPALPLLWLDTLKLEKYCVSHFQQRQESCDLRLSSIRQRYHLPEYNAHNALTDAIATAELFLAVYNRLALHDKSCFGDIYRASL